MTDLQSLSAPPIAGPGPDSAPRANRRRRWRIYLLRSLIWLLIALVFAVAFRQGVRLRKWMYVTFDPIRFRADIYRGCYWGLIASGPEGYLNQYDKMEPQLPDRLDARWIPWLDYAPLRLLIMEQWGAWQRVHFPPKPYVPLMRAWQPQYEFTAPVLWFNTAMEILAAVCAFFLTRLWVIRGHGGGEPLHHFDGVWQGAVAALLLWFSPDLLISAHAWLTWDTWIIPWFLLTALLASLDWWFAAGLAMGIGAMFKGQQLFVASIFIAWPIMQGRFAAALRWIVGLALAIALIGSGWLLSYIPPSAKLDAARAVQQSTPVAMYPPDLFAIPRIFDWPAAVWIGLMLLATAAAPFVRSFADSRKTAPQPTRLKTILHSRWTWLTAAAALIFIAGYWPFLAKSNRQYGSFGFVGAGALAAAALFFHPRKPRYLLPAVAAAGLFSCIALFHGGDGWLKCTFGYGLDHWPYMTQGLSANVPAVFEHRFGWSHDADQIAFTLPAIAHPWPAMFTTHAWWPAASADITAKTLFDSLFIFFLILSALGVGIQARRGDRRMLVALVTPWIMFFLWPVQIHERYLVFASGIAVCCIGNSFGTCLLGIFLSLCSAVMLMNVLFSNVNPSAWQTFGQNLSATFPTLFTPQSGTTMAQYISATFPDMAWGILVVGMIFLYLSFTRSAARRSHTRRFGVER
jgi:hypothetical protein